MVGVASASFVTRTDPSFGMPKADNLVSEDLRGGRSSIWLEHKIVDLGVAGSIPVAHPRKSLSGSIPERDFLLIA